jgi:aromatic ring-opening dioxygenase catalytic subunit (LigB family)
VSRDLQVALDSYLFALFLEQATEACVMDAITLDHGHWCGLAISYPDGRIVLGNVSDGRTLD